MAARQAAAEVKRGGGESGSMERGKSKALADATGEMIGASAATPTGCGSTKAMELASERSES
jgi:hypothetical protein